MEGAEVISVSSAEGISSAPERAWSFLWDAEEIIELPSLLPLWPLSIGVHYQEHTNCSNQCTV